MLKLENVARNPWRRLKVFTKHIGSNKNFNYICIWQFVIHMSVIISNKRDGKSKRWDLLFFKFFNLLNAVTSTGTTNNKCNLEFCAVHCFHQRRIEYFKLFKTEKFLTSLYICISWEMVHAEFAYIRVFIA